LPTAVAEKEDANELVTRAKDGDEQALSRLITIHKGLVYTIIYRMVNDADTSQDLTQDTFIKAFLHINRVKNYEHFRPWLCRIARNVVYDHFRREKRHKTVSIDDVGEIAGQQGMGKMRKKMIIQNALSRLSERDRMLLSLAYYQGFTLAEAADVLDITEDNAKVALHRARKRLRKELRGYEDELLST
jgi:RNA polymerase sigma factor (sigma-70 family)